LGNICHGVFWFLAQKYFFKGLRKRRAK